MLAGSSVCALSSDDLGQSCHSLAASTCQTEDQTAGACHPKDSKSKNATPLVLASVLVISEPNASTA